MVIEGKGFLKPGQYDGIPKSTDLKLVNVDIDDNLVEGEMVVKALYISVDPYQRTSLNAVDPSKPVGGFQLAEVTKSKSDKYPVGSLVYNLSGWQSVSKINESLIWNRVDDIKPKIDTKHFMGSVGMPGLTAYFGLLEICQPKAGETVMVSTCAGAVGSVVGQIAKIKGCRVIGSCGSEEKMDYARSIGYDGVFNYKTENATEVISKLAPNGIDCYFDNVGGELSSQVMAAMNTGGRIAVCGAIASYNAKEPPLAPMVQGLMIYKGLKMEGFVVMRFTADNDKKNTAYSDLVKWISEGKIKSRETIYEGFERIPEAFIGLFLGKNIGKSIIKV